MLRRARRVRVKREEVHRRPRPIRVLRERHIPVIRLRRRRRTPHQQIRVNLLHGARRLVIQPEVLGLRRPLPELRQRRLVPHLHRPGAHLRDPVPVHQMRQRGPHQSIPLTVVRRRGHIPLPPEHRLIPRRQILGHEPQLQERLDPQLQVRVDHLVQIRPRVPRPHEPTDVVPAQNPQPVMEDPMPTNVLEPDGVLHHRKRILVVPAQAKDHLAGPDDLAPGIGQRADGGGGDDDGAH